MSSPAPPESAKLPEPRTLRNECWDCEHRRAVPGSAHFACAKPDPDMVGHPHGIANGWFAYPFCFDPVWKTASCAHFEEAAQRREVA